MSEMKTSKLLAQLMERSKLVGDRRNPPFTAERFLVAIIDGMSVASGEKPEELVAAEAILSTMVEDTEAAKEKLLAYICQDQNTSLIDDLYTQSDGMSQSTI